MPWRAPGRSASSPTRPQNLTAFSGTVARGELFASAPLGRGHHLGAGYQLTRDAADARELSFLEHGPVAELRLGARRAGAGQLKSALARRVHDVRDAALGVRRADTWLAGAARVAWDLAQRWSLRASLEGRRVVSNAPAFSLFQLVPALGLAYAGP